MNFKTIIAILSFSIILNICSAQCISGKAPSKIGTQLPNLELSPILNFNQQKAKLHDFKGKVVILNFWATWCSPCVKALSHLDVLQEEFKENLQIFAVTNSDSKQRIEKFLTKFNTKLAIVVDSIYILKKEYPHRTISHTVLIGIDGKVKAVTKPDKITSEIINKAIKGESIAIEEKRDVFGFDYDAPLPDENLKFKFKLTGYNEAATAMRKPITNGKVFLTNHSLWSLYAFSYPITINEMYRSRSIFRVNFYFDGKYYPALKILKDKEHKYYQKKEDAYCLEIVAPDFGPEKIYKMMISFLHQNFELKSRLEKRKTKVKILKRIKSPLKLKKASPDPESRKASGYGGGGISYYNTKVSIIARFLEGMGIAGMPVLDETGLTDNYDIEMTFSGEDPDQFYKDLKEMGLEVVDAEREIEMLILYEEDKTINSTKN